MKKITIAFDIDGTLRDNRVVDWVKANERIRTLLIILASFKNTHIMVWSGGGELYARQCARELGITDYVDSYADKGLVSGERGKPYVFDYQGRHVDIAIDDMHGFELGDLNLIVNEK